MILGLHPILTKLDKGLQQIRRSGYQATVGLLDLNSLIFG
jgi:hypothetical protein